MSRYIDADTLSENIIRRVNNSMIRNWLLSMVSDQQTADAVEVKRGEWVYASNKPSVNIGMKCSLCGARIKNSEFFNGNHNYCHKCGADMRGDKR